METFMIRAVAGMLWVVLMALFLTACGGDGGSLTDTPTVAPPPSPSKPWGDLSGTGCMRLALATAKAKARIGKVDDTDF